MFYSHTGGCRLHGPPSPRHHRNAFPGVGEKGGPRENRSPHMAMASEPLAGARPQQEGRRGRLPRHCSQEPRAATRGIRQPRGGDPLSQPRGLWRGQGRLRRGCCGPATAAALISYLFLSSNTCCSPPVAALQMGTLWDPSAYTLRLPGFPEGLPRVTMPGGT